MASGCQAQETSSTRTLLRATLSCFAIAAGPMPASFMAGRTLRVGIETPAVSSPVAALCLRLGYAFLRCRSSMISRSQVATPARMVSISLLVVGARVEPLPPMLSTIRPTPRFDRSAWKRCRANRPCCGLGDPLGDHQHVTLAYEVQAGLQDVALGNRRRLLGVELLSAGTLQVALLRAEAGRLVAGAGSGITDDRIWCLVRPVCI